MDDIKLPPLPEPAPLTYEQMLDCVRAVGTPAPMGLTRDHGPYEITEPTWFLIQLVRAIERALGIGNDAAPAPHPDTADAERWRHVWQCVRMAQHGEYVLLPDEPTGLPDDSIVRARFLQEVDAALDAARAHGIGASTGSKP